MKRLITGLVVCASIALTCIASTPKAYAEQGYAWVDYIASTQQVTLGDQFTISMYVTGRDNTQYGKVGFAVEAWTPGDPNPPVGYEFVSFTPGSDFPISNSQGVIAGQYGAQCRYYERSSAANLTGKHLFGTVTYRATSNHWAGYSFMPFMNCKNTIEDPAGNWGIVWDYGGAFLTVKNPAASTPSTPANGSSTSNKPANTSGTKQNTPNKASGQAVLSDSTNNAAATKPTNSGQPTKPAASNTAQHKTLAATVTAAHAATKAYWALASLIPIAGLTFILWKTDKLPHLPLRRK
jgi:hypothetical protein